MNVYLLPSTLPLAGTRSGILAAFLLLLTCDQFDAHKSERQNIMDKVENQPQIKSKSVLIMATVVRGRAIVLSLRSENVINMQI